jgi:CubicO group peptidase (beta-lactamase class C family)
MRRIRRAPHGIGFPRMFPPFVALLLALPAFAPRSDDELLPSELVEGEHAYRIDEFLTRLEGLGFAGVVGVEDEGVPILVRGYGLADRARGRPVTPDTVFDLGSITKPFTAAAILALQDDGRLAVADPLARHLPGVPEDKRALTLHHLLTHTSGLSDPPRGDHDLAASAAWVREWALAQPLEHAPGAEHAYRNVNYSLLGLVIERVSGEGYEAFLRRRLLAPAGLARTGYLLPRYAEHELARGTLGGEPWGTTLERPMLADGPAWTLRANGGLHSTVGDVLRWHHALLEDVVLSPAARALAESPFADEGGGTAYGYGWSIQRSPSGKKLVAHNGGNGVFFADFLRFVEEGRCVFVATPVGSRFRETLAYDVAAILFGRPARAVPETLPRERAWLERYAGRYPFGAGSVFELRAEDDRLVLFGRGAEALELLCDESERTRLAAARALGAELCAGRVQPLLEAYAGPVPLDELGAALVRAQAAFATRLGAFRALGEPALRGARELRIALEAHFERGTAHVTFAFGPGGRVLGCELLDSAPFEPGVRLELFPLAADEFQTYDERAAHTWHVRFALDPDGRASALRLGDPEVELARG